MTATNWPYNSRHWQRLRLMVLKDEPFCRYCAELKKITPAEMVDHILPVKDRPDLAFVYDNLQPLCRDCHDSVKRREEATGKRIGCGLDGSPVDKWHWWNE